MPLTNADLEKDVLGDLLKQPSADPSAGYDPYQWQAAANGQGKNRVLLHGSGNDALEVIERPAPIPRMVNLPGTLEKDRPVIERFFEDNADLLPHVSAIDAEVRNIRRNAPDFGSSDAFNLAISRVCKANNLPLEREAPLPTPLKAPTLRDEIKRLEAEARKTRTNVGQDFESVGRAIRETEPAPRKRR